MLEILRNALDNSRVTGLYLADLSKAIDCLHHDLLLLKLYVYGYSYESLMII